ncbi:MAG: FkbM family methyltransferase [Pirellulales bacterium]|nr:FkbM family methyltransferase [Pirellulales bacterium]
MDVCRIELVERLPDGRNRWRCPDCGHGGVTPHPVGRIHPGPCPAKLRLALPANCAPCAARRQWLNRLLPGTGDAVARLAQPVARWLGWQRRPRLLLRFAHGFGDAVQLTVVLRHLRLLQPDWDVDVLVKPGWASLYRGLVRHAFEGELPHVHADSHAELAGRGLALDYDLDVWLPFLEPDRCYADAPSTKAERCLRETFGIVPRLEQCGYWTPFGRAELARVDAYYRALPAHAGVVLIHYQGRTVQQAKNLDERIVAEVCRRARAAGCMPVVLDFESPQRSRLIDGREVFGPGLGHPLWPSATHGDAATIAALAHRARLCVGIDSGPGHVMAGEQVGTPTLIAWRAGPLHPLHYFPPAEHVIHVVPRTHASALRAAADAGREFFRRHYRYVVAERHLRVALPELVGELLARGSIVERLAPPTLEYEAGHWIRPDARDDDLANVAEIWRDDVYRLDELRGPIRRVLDVGAHIGSFTTRLLERFPDAEVVCIEPHPEAQAALARNLGGRAQVLEAAVACGGGPWRLVEPDERRAPSNARLTNGTGPGHPVRQVWSLDALLDWLGWSEVDLVKLDCEGSEADVLSSLGDGGRVGTMVGEYHGGRSRLAELVARRFPAAQLTWLTDKRPAHDDGTFRLEWRGGGA